MRRALFGLLIQGEILVDSDQAEALASRGLKVKVRVRCLKPPDTEIEDPPNRFFHIVGLYFQPNRPEAAQELALISDIAIDKPDMEVFSQANGIPFRVCFGDLAAEDVTIESTNAVAMLPRHENRPMVSKDDLCHGYFYPLGSYLLG